MKKILLILLTITMLLSTCLLAVSCGGNENGGSENGGENGGDNGGGETTPPTGTDYTVTVVDINGTPVSGISVKFTYGNNGVTDVFKTGADGKATAKIDTLSDVIVEFVDLVGYGSPRKSERNFDGVTEKTVTLLPIVTVKAVDENGNAIAGVTLQICHSICMLPQVTDENGEISLALNPEAAIKVAVNEVPSGYEIPEAIGEIEGVPYHKYFDEGSFEATVVIPSADVE